MTDVHNVVLVHGGSSTAPAGRGCMRRSPRTATASWSCRTRPCPWRATPPLPGRSSTAWTARSCYGFLFLDRDKFHASFADDLPAGQAAFMADSQVPWGVDALGGTISEAAWRIKPSKYLLTTQDRKQCRHGWNADQR